MMALNFLPWRELRVAREKRRRRILWAGIFSVGCGILASIFFLAMQPPPPRATVPDLAAAEILQLQTQLNKSKFTGYLQQNHRIWGIVILPDGKTIAVQTGSRLLGTAQVLAVTQTKLIISVPGTPVRIIIPFVHS
jgi:hypothetical protein